MEIDPEIFRPGLTIVLELKDRPGVKMTSFFRGFKNKDYLIIEHPSKEGKLVPVGDEALCVIRFIYDGNVIGFRSRIIAVIRTPYPLIFVRFPQAVETSKLRKSERYPVRIDSVCSNKPLYGAVDAYPRDVILNLSSGGCQVEAFEPQEKESIIYMTIFLPETRQVNDVEVEVKRVEKRGEKYLLGLSFADVIAQNYEIVKNYIQTLEAFQVRA